MPAEKRFPAAAFIAAWSDHTQTIAAIASRFGMCTATVKRAAASMQLPGRPRGAPVKVDRARLAVLWRAGWTCCEIGAALGVSAASLHYHINDMRLPRRGKGVGGGGDAFSRLRKHMARTAALEQSAIINAEMADGAPTGGQLVGQAKARGM